MTTQTNQQKWGQYFTTNTELKQQVLNFIQNEPDVILEPSLGRGDLVEFVKNHYPAVRFDLYEIDDRIDLLPSIPRDTIKYGDFLQQVILRKYKTIVGNPPYVKGIGTKKNLYIQFIEKCFRLLDDGGEMVFIVPSVLFQTTGSCKLLQEMLQQGSFTHIFHPNNEHLFENASIDVIVFRYCQGANSSNPVLYNDKTVYLTNNNGFISFHDQDQDQRERDGSQIFQDCFDIYVGMVNGKEEVYKNAELGNIEVLNGQGQTDKYIFIEKYPCLDDRINQYLLDYKTELINRKIRRFTESNWTEWGAPRNKTAVEKNLGKECIYLSNLTRNPVVAFSGKVQYFGGSLLLLIPKPAYEKTGFIEKTVGYLNSQEFKHNFMFSGRFKIGHRSLSNSTFPNSHSSTNSSHI